jgi:hypothetical protein
LTKHGKIIILTVVLAAIGFAAVRPLPFHLHSGLPSPPGFSDRIQHNDPAIFCWNLWWMNRWISGKNTLFDCDMLHHPFGISLRRHTLSPANGILAAPLLHALGPVPSYNLLIIFHALLTVFGMYRLARECGADPLPALMVSALFTWWPARLVHAGIHLNLASTGWLILAFLFLVRACRGRSWKPVLPALFFFLLTGASSWHLLQLLCMMIPMAVFLNDTPGISLAHRIFRVLTVTTAGLLLLSPLILPLAESDPDMALIALEESMQYSIEPAALLIPPAGNPVFKNLVASYYASVPGNAVENTGFIGFSVLALLIIGWIRGGFRERLLITAGALFVLLALGPYLHAGAVRIPLPLKLLNTLPFMQYSRTPGRFMIAAGLLWSLTCARILTAGTQKKRTWLYLLSGVFLIEFLPGKNTIVFTGDMPEYRTRAVSDSAAILVVPNDWSNPYYMLGQTCHEKPISTGFTARMPGTVFQRISGIPHLERLSDPDTAYETLQTLVPLDFIRLRELLAADTLIFHSRFCRPVPVDASERLAHLQPEIAESAGDKNQPDLIINLASFTGTISEPEYYLLDRWSGPEDWGIETGTVYWGLYPAARIRFLGLKRSDIFSFEITAARQAESVPVRVNIRFADQIVQSFSIVPEDGWVPVAINTDGFPGAIDGSPADAGTYHDLWFEFSSGTPPAEISQTSGISSSDTRKLAAAVRRLSVKRESERDRQAAVAGDPAEGIAGYD